MKLNAHRNLIANLPVQQQAFTSRKEMWRNRLSQMPDELAVLFGANSIVTLSRADLFQMAKSATMPQFVYGVVLWGYPDGGRGNNVPNLVAKMNQIQTLITGIRNNGNQILDWNQHWKNAFVQADMQTKIDGFGLSTYSKLLYFMKTKVNGHQCLILDQVLINVFTAGKFEEFSQLRTISYQTAPTLYPAYLEVMQKEAAALDVRPDQLELFLFMFGPIIK